RKPNCSTGRASRWVRASTGATASIRSWCRTIITSRRIGVSIKRHRRAVARDVTFFEREHGAAGRNPPGRRVLAWRAQGATAAPRIFAIQEDTMRMHARSATLAFALVALAGAASAQTMITEPLDTRPVIAQRPLPLTPAQRTTVYRTIVPRTGG